MPGRRPDAAVHEQRDGPVQGGLHRGRDAELHAGRRLPALPAGRRQAQRLRGGRAVAAPPHPVRDARQLELRRLLQARGDPLGLGAPDRRPTGSPPIGWPPRPTRTTRSPGPSGATRSACRPSGWRAGATSRPATTRTSGGWPTPGRAGRAARSTSTGASSSRRAPSASPTTPSTARAGSSSGTSCSWSSTSVPTGRVPLPFPSVDTGHGPGAPGERPPAGPEQLRHRPVHADPRPDARAPRSRPGRVRAGALQLPGHRRPLAGDHVPHRRRGAARRTRVAATSCAGSCAGRSATGGCSAGASRSWPRPRQVVIDTMGEAYPHLVERRDDDPRGDRPRGGPVRPDPRRRHGHPRGGAHPADVGRASRRTAARGPPGRCAGPGRRRRVPAPRHVRLPDRPDDRAGRRVRGRGRPCRASRSPSPSSASGAGAGARPSWPSTPSSTALYERLARAARRDDVPRLRDDAGRGGRPGDPARRDRVRRAGRLRRRRGADRTRRGGRDRPRPDPVLRRGRRPDRRSRGDPRRGRVGRLRGRRHAATHPPA